MPSVQDTCDLYDKLISVGYNHPIVLPISSVLSRTINIFRLDN
ncbi:DegV family protein [Clostridium saudiense]|nr:DegV family protein [Clostridium saudiense]